MREYALYTPATLLRSGSRSIYYVFCGELESEAREKLHFCQIRVQRGIPYAKIPIGPVRQPKFRIKPERAQPRFKTAADERTFCAAVSQLEQRLITNAVELLPR